MKYPISVILLSLIVLGSVAPVHALTLALRPEKLLEMKFDIDESTLPEGVSAGYRYEVDSEEPGLNLIGPTLYNASDKPFYIVTLARHTLDQSHPNSGLPDEYYPHLKYVSGKVYQYRYDLGKPVMDLRTGELSEPRAQILPDWYEIEKDPREVQAFNWRTLRQSDANLSALYPWGSGEINVGFYKDNAKEYREQLSRKDDVSILAYYDGQPLEIKATLTYERPRFTFHHFRLRVAEIIAFFRNYFSK